MSVPRLLIKSISFKGLDGRMREQPVEYEWIPQKCTRCHRWGHEVDVCSVKPRTVQEWRSKPSVVVEKDTKGKGKGCA